MKELRMWAYIYAALSTFLLIMIISLNNEYVGQIESNQLASQAAMLLMVDKYIEDTKDMPVTIRCKKVAKACNYSYLRTGR